MSRGNLFQHIPTDLDEEVFETLVQSGTVKIERIISSSHTSPESGWYDQDKEEWVIVLRGSATISFADGSAVDLQEGDYLAIPAHRKHRVSRTSSEPETVWLAVHY
jgi:cupin 2 domain-containing protein